MKALITLVVHAILEWITRFIMRKQSEAEAQKRREEEIEKEVAARVEALKRAESEAERAGATESIARDSF